MKGVRKEVTVLSARETTLACLILAGCGGAIEGGAEPGGNSSTFPGRNPLPSPVGTTPAAGPEAVPIGTLPPGAGALDPGRVTLRRLNRVEHDNTLRDLLGTALTPGERLPGDEVDHGFDTLGSAIGVSPVHVELYEAAAEDLVEELLARPAGDPWRAGILVCGGGDDACLRQILTGLGGKAWRRPLVDAELTRLTTLASKARAATGRADDGLRAALRAVLLSPHFLFRVERYPAGGGSAARQVSDHELAARMSYFLWSTMPDDELARAADAGKLSKDGAEVERQLTRMLADRKAESLSRHFARSTCLPSGE